MAVHIQQIPISLSLLLGVRFNKIIEKLVLLLAVVVTVLNNSEMGIEVVLDLVVCDVANCPSTIAPNAAPRVLLSFYDIIW